MDVPTWVWLVTIGGLLTLLVIDLVIVDARPHQIKVGEAGRWVAFYVGCAVLFGLGLWQTVGAQYAGEFFAGYITEYSLSVDNLFVFVLIMSTFAVPAIHQHKVLLFGILAALVLRGLFIAAGSAVIAQFQWVFYGFGLFLLYTGWRLAFGNREDAASGFQENRVLRLARRVLPVTSEYHGARVLIRLGGRRCVTPMLVVMIAIGTTDLLFALDSIPAIFGLTKEPFLVFTANAFALMGLRQLFFLLGGLLNRLVYLDKGLAVILGFIGVKLFFEAMAGSGFDWAPHFGIELSLGVIVVVLAITTAASLLKVRYDPSAAKPPPGAAAAPSAVPPADPAGSNGAAPAAPAPAPAAGSPAPGSPRPAPSAPGSAGPGTAGRGSSAPGPSAPGSSAAGSTARGPSAPGPFGPGSSVPGSAVRGSSVPASPARRPARGRPSGVQHGGEGAAVRSS